MATGGGYTVDNESFCRLYRFVCEIVPKPIRRLLENNSPKGNVQNLLRNSNTQIQIMRTKGILQNQQYMLLHPPPGKVFDIKDWDITLLCNIVKNVCNIKNRSIKVALDDLRNERNKLSHCSAPELTLADFNVRWTAVETSLKVITKSLNDQAFETAITDEYSNVKTGPVSVQPIFDIFKTHIHVYQNVKTSVDNLDKDVKEMNKDVQEFKHIHLNKSQESLRAFEDHEKKMKKELETVKYAAIETRNAVKDIQSDIYSRIRKKPSPENKPKLPKAKPRITLQPKIKVLHKQTEAILQTKVNYVSTEQFREAENTLVANNCVVICGGLGEGKTSAAFELMRRNKQQKRCIQILNPDDINLIEPNAFDFVFIDDIFGNYELDENKFQPWVAVFEKLQNLVTSKAFKLIITSSEIAFNESRGLLEKYSLFKDVIFFKTDKLKTKEKQDILHQCLTRQNRVLSFDSIEKCVAAYKSSSRFPYVCFLFASDDTFFEEKEKIFLRKEAMDIEILSHFNKAKQLSLLYLWLKGGYSCKISDFPTKNCSLEMLSRRLDYSKDKDISTLCHEVKRNLDVMSGAFIKKQDNGYEFAHNSIYRTVGLFFARHGFHDIIIAQSNIDFFMECIRIDEHDGNRDYTVPRNLYKRVVDRIIFEVMQNKRCRAMAIHPCLSDEILGILIRTLTSLNKFKEFFLSEKSESTSVIYYASEDDKFGQFLFHSLKSTSSVSITVLKAAIKHLKCGVHFGKNDSCKVCKMFTNAFKGACRGGNMEALKLLPFVKVQASELIDTVFSNRKEVYQFVASKIKRYKENNELKMQCLQLSVILGHAEVFNLILHAGMKPDISCFKLAVSNKRYEFIENILRHLALSAEHEIVSDMLRNLDSYEKYTALAQCDLLPSKADVKHSINMFGERVKPILWDLKYSYKSHSRRKRNLWLILSGDDDTREILIEYGLVLTEDYLINMTQVDDIEKVKDTLQYLEKYGEWHPNDDLSERIVDSVLSSGNSEYKIYKFFLARGFQPSPSILHKTVVCYCGLDIVKQTVSKMKEFNCFDNTNSQIQHSMLESVYSPEIYNFFEAEGVDLLDLDVNQAFDIVFFKPDLFKCLTKKFNISNTKYSILDGVRESNIQLVQENFLYLEANNKWEPDDIVLQLSLLESDMNISEFLLARGVTCDDILDKAFKYKDEELVAYILSLAVNNKYNLRISEYDNVNLKTLYLLAEYCAVDKLKVLKRALQLDNKNGIMSTVALLKPFENTTLESKEASDLLFESAKYERVYVELLNVGFIPDMFCFYHTAYYNSSMAFKETLHILFKRNRFHKLDQYTLLSMIAAIKHKNENVVRMLVDYGIKPTVECLKHAVMNDRTITQLVLTFIDPLELQSSSQDMTDIVNDCILNFQFYELLSDWGVRPNSSNLLKFAEIVSESSPDIQLRQNLMRVLTDFIKGNEWSFTDNRLLQFEQLVNRYIPELSSTVRSEREKFEVKFVISELEKQHEATLLSTLNCSKIEPNSVLPHVLRWYCLTYVDVTTDAKIDSILKFIDESQTCSISLKILSEIVRRDSSRLLERYTRRACKDFCLETALEMAIYFDQDNATSKLLHNLNVSPTPFCLFQATTKGKISLGKELLELMPFAEIQRSDPYLKLSLSHCVSTNDTDMFRSIMKETKFEIDSEILFEAVLSRNESMVLEIKRYLEQMGKWDYSLKDYWISSAFLEASGSTSIISCLEDNYDDAISILETHKETAVNNMDKEIPIAGTGIKATRESLVSSNSDLYDTLSSFSDSSINYEDIE